VSLYLAYARRGRNAFWRYLAATALAVLLAVVLGTLAAAGLLAAGVALPTDPGSTLDPAHPGGFMAMTAAGFGALLAGFVLAVRWLQAKRLGDLVGRWRWRLFWIGAGVWTGLAALLVLIDLPLAPGSVRLTAGPGTAGFALVSLAALAPQTFAEELIFRGYLTQGLLLAFRRPLPAALASGVLFALLHLPNGAPQAASALVFGVVLSLIAIRLGGLAFTFGLHLANNLFGAVVVVSTSDLFHGAPGLFAQHAPQLMWWDAAAASAALLAVAAGVRRATRDRADGAGDAVPGLLDPAGAE
jgi:membrane protease YdiL (CAAX protease family)